LALRQGSPIRGSALENVQVTSFATKTVAMTQKQLDGLRSVRVRNVTEGVNVGCSPLGIIAILIG
jgi:hypothetical protein